MRRHGPGDKRDVLAALNRIVVLALPPRCPGCGAVTEADHRFCAACFASLELLGPPWCASCARPFAFDRGLGARCGTCLADPPRHAGARAAVAYGPVAKRLALRLKYGGRAAFAETAARMMMRLLPADADMVVPVPLHRWRLWSRGYNQAALIAHALASDRTRHALERRRPTPVLRGLGRSGRAKAVRGAFAVVADVRSAHVVLVDDIYTTGATADACTRALLAAGAARVTVLCWARVIEEAGD